MLPVFLEAAVRSHTHTHGMSFNGVPGCRIQPVNLHSGCTTTSTKALTLYWEDWFNTGLLCHTHTHINTQYPGCRHMCMQALTEKLDKSSNPPKQAGINDTQTHDIINTHTCTHMHTNTETLWVVICWCRKQMFWRSDGERAERHTWAKQVVSLIIFSPAPFK